MQKKCFVTVLDSTNRFLFDSLRNHRVEITSTQTKKLIAIQSIELTDSTQLAERLEWLHLKSMISFFVWFLSFKNIFHLPMLNLFSLANFFPKFRYLWMYTSQLVMNLNRTILRSFSSLHCQSREIYYLSTRFWLSIIKDSICFGTEISHLVNNDGSAMYSSFDAVLLNNQ